MELKKITGARIKKYRLEKNLKQEELGKLLGVSQTTIAAWEKSKQEPSIDKLNKLAKILEVSIEYLVGSDAQTEEDYYYLNSDTFLYKDTNYLTKEEITQITMIKNELNEYKAETTKLPDPIDIDKMSEIISTTMAYENEIMDIILSNKNIKKWFFERDYVKQPFDRKSKHVIENMVVSAAQNIVIEKIKKLTNDECFSVIDYLYHLNHKTKQYDIFQLTLYLKDENLDNIEANLIGLNEQEGVIKKIRQKYTHGETK